MKFVIQIKNYDCNDAFIDTDKKKFALNTHRFSKGFYNSEVHKFIEAGSFYETPELLLQRKTDFYNFVEALKQDGYEEIEFIPEQELTEEREEL